MRATSSRSVSVSTVGCTAPLRVAASATSASWGAAFAASAGPAPTCAALARSLGVVDGARLPDDGDLDLTRVLELVLDAARDVLREPDRLFVRDLLALHHDANFAAGLE